MDTPDGPRKLCERFNVPGDAHELTFCCYKRRAFLSKPRTCKYLVDAISGAREKHAFHLWAYVFMPDHVHLLIWPTRPKYSVSGILQSIKQSVSRKALVRLRKHNPGGLRQLATGQKRRPYRFWQGGGGYDRNVVSRATLRACLEYLHNNPVRKELVPYAEDWSSARQWDSGESGPLRIDKESFPTC